MNKKYEELSQFIKKSFDDRSQDVCILKSLFAQVNLEHNPMADGTPDLKNGTKFSKISDKKLVSLFEKEHFNEMSKTDLTHLMQEAHNRFIKQSGYEVTRNVVVKEDNPEERGVCGYVYYGDDMLFINKDMIDECKQLSPEVSTLNRDTIGKFFLDTVWHETKHIIQYEDGMDFVLGREQSLERAFSGALMVINNTNFQIAEMKEDWYGYVFNWKNNYRNHFYEHEANYDSFMKVVANESAEVKKSYNFDQYVVDSTHLALNFQPELNNPERNKELVQQRIMGYERFLQHQLSYFIAGTHDCSIKKDIINIMNKYMEVDENGNSMLRDRLNKEINDFIDCYIASQKRLNKFNKQNQNKVTLDTTPTIDIYR